MYKSLMVKHNFNVLYQKLIGEISVLETYNFNQKSKVLILDKYILKQTITLVQIIYYKANLITCKYFSINNFCSMQTHSEKEKKNTLVNHGKLSNIMRITCNTLYFFFIC